MEIKDYDFNNPKEFHRMCKDAAEGCFYPPKNQRQGAMSLIIQNLVLPRSVEGFDVAAMTGYIKTRMQTTMAIRTVLDDKEEK